MKSLRIKAKSIFALILEQGIGILIKKECKKIVNLKIDLKASSIQIIKGEIEKINITAKEINYKDLLFDEFEMEANQIKIDFRLTNKELEFKNNPIINFKISCSENSIKSILLSNNWNWVRDIIIKSLLITERLDEIKISNNQLLFKASEKDISMNQETQVELKTDKGKLYLLNKKINKTIQIPIEDKIYIKSVNINNNVIIISANSYISF